MTSDTVFTAHFAIDSHYVSVTQNDSAIGFAYFYGLNGEMVNSATLPHGYWVEMYAVPNTNLEGYQCSFLQWNDGNTDAYRQIELMQDTMLVAMFEAQPLEGIPTATGLFSVTMHADGIELVGADGQVTLLCDVIGRILWRSVAGQRLFIPIDHAGAYVLRIGDHAVRKVVFR